MTNGTSQGLLVIVAIVIFGIFVGISYLLFGEKLNTGLANIFTDSLEQSENILKGKDKETNNFKLLKPTDVVDSEKVISKILINDVEFKEDIKLEKGKRYVFEIRYSFKDIKDIEKYNVKIPSYLTEAIIKKTQTTDSLYSTSNTEKIGNIEVSVQSKKTEEINSGTAIYTYDMLVI
ncbi:hypothetical protein [Vagococcus fluvialis]|uniref:hypothetical protein n=1 Tax=Vagococcus fluvialis TaxID=2738 RepID=UPI001D0B6D8B|nr:hypothetical protein [Vagococcus fluvialis]UDM84097.1 hypothetical protein K5K96_15195 [Vagococcus fluvialis]